MKRLHEQVKAKITKKNESYAKQANKNRKKLVLDPNNEFDKLPEKQHLKLHFQ